jgi:SAM-dependent methyltransferase
MSRGLPRAPIPLQSARRLQAEVARGGCLLDAGSGGRRLDDTAVAVDVVPRVGVDVVADVCGRLPFRDGSFDLVVCTSVLEHVPDAAAAAAELVRVTRQGGRLWIEIPFLYHFHVSSLGDTSDYRRWTIEGARRLLPGCAVLEIGHNVAPGTALRLFASEVLAQPLHSESHGGPYHLTRWILEWLLLPLSLLDGVCSRRSVSHRATGGFWVLAEKR